MNKNILLLKDCTLFIKNGASIKQINNCKEGYPITRIETISNDIFNRNRMGYAKIFNLEKYSNYILEDKDILFSHINGEKQLGRSVIYHKQDNEYIIHGMNLLCIRANPQIINSKYLCFFLNSKFAKKFIAKHTKRAVNQASIASSDVLKMPVIVYDLDKQNEIVSNLEIINQILCRLNKMINLYDELIKSRFIEMFGDPLINPKSLKFKKFGEVFNLNAGGTPSKNIKEYWDNGTISWIGSNLCQNVILYKNDGKYISQKGFEHSSAKMFDEDTVLIALVGATIGKVALLKFKTTTNQNVLGVQNIKEAGYNPYFVFYYTQQLLPLFLNIGGGGFNMASKKFVSNLDIYDIDITEQNKFAEFVELIDKSKLNYIKNKKLR